MHSSIDRMIWHTVPAVIDASCGHVVGVTARTYVTAIRMVTLWTKNIAKTIWNQMWNGVWRGV